MRTDLRTDLRTALRSDLRTPLRTDLRTSRGSIGAYYEFGPSEQICAGEAVAQFQLHEARHHLPPPIIAPSQRIVLAEAAKGEGHEKLAFE